MNKTVLRFLKYFFVGFTTFSFDLFLLYVFTDILLFNYLFAAGLAYLIAVSINYYLSRRFVFPQTVRELDKGYYSFITISGVGLLFVIGLMYFAVEVLNLNHLVSRVIVAGIVGMWNYLMNLFFNFKVAGKH